MTKYYFIIIILFSFVTIFLSTNSVKASLPLNGKLIVVDPGHGGLDPGTSYQKVYEKDLNLKISLALEEELSKLGASVMLTRTGDYDLSSPGASLRKRSDFDNRIKLINNSKADLYLSIHLNYLNDNSYYGPQVFYDQNNEKLALIMQNRLNENLKGNRKIKKIPSSIYMYSKLKIKGILIECGFMSNEIEFNKLITSDYQNKIAKTIANSLSFYFL